MEEKGKSRKMIVICRAGENEEQQINIEYEDRAQKTRLTTFFRLKTLPSAVLQLASEKNHSWEKETILNCPRVPVLSQ